MNPSSSSRKWLLVGFAGVAVLVAGYLALSRGLGMRVVDAGIATNAVRVDYSPWNDALEKWVVQGRVDYGQVMGEQGRLRTFAAELAQAGPTTTPHNFASNDQQLAYYINAYNALVLLGVVEVWPIDSVQDVRGLVEPKPGFGFFYGLWFKLDGRYVNLYNLEHQTIRGFHDARIHAAINCASVSCPALQPFAYDAERLDAQLDRVTREFCSEAQHVSVDHEHKTITLSAIFDWYAEDFIEHAVRLKGDRSVLGFIEAFAIESVGTSVRQARIDGYEIHYAPYNWQLNRM